MQKLKRYAILFRAPRIPKDLIEYCEREVRDSNQRRLRLLIPPVLCAVLTIVAVYVAGALQNGINALSAAYVAVNSCYACFLAACWLAPKIFRKKKRAQISPYVVIACSLLWAASLSLLDQRGYNSVTYYLIALLVLSVAFVSKFRIFFSIQLPILLPLLIALPFFQPDHAMLTGAYVNTLFCTLISLFISRLLYRTALEGTANKKIVETEAASTRDALARFEMVWNNVDSGIALIDAETREIIDINPTAVRLYGGEKHEIVGKPCHRHICPAKERACPIIDGKRPTDRRECTFLTADGSMVPIIKSVARVNFMGRQCMLESFSDITEMKKAEEHLTLLDVTQRANQAKSDFLARMSHEMRTPMNAIIGMTKIAEGSDNMATLRHCMTTIGASSDHLLNIINDVLDMAKIEAGKFDLECAPLNIEKTLMKICNIVIDQMEKKKQKFHVVLSKGLTLHYVADDLRLSQVLTNLLSNAVKFTPVGGTITLTVDKVGQQGNQATLRFSVADTGIGMSEQQIARLFNAFEQADGSIARKFGGTGLGLVISQNIVEKMGGHISVESEPGAGAVFTFEVTLECSPHKDTVIFNGIRPEDIRLLIVESDECVCQHFMGIVRSFGINADAASSAEEAIRLTRESYNTNKAYDIIFLNYEMPGANGFDVVRQLSSWIDKNTVIIITTFKQWHHIEKTAQENNITRYITKPIFPSSVLDAINEVVGSRLKSLDISADMGGEVPDLSGITVLLAEDIDINQEIFIALLNGTGIEIDTAENGLEAVSKFKNDPERYDAIVMDIQMPEMDGYEATRTIRALEIPQAKTVPIIAMTANAFKEDIDRCLESGMNDHLPKPIDEKAAMEKIRRYTKGVQK